MFMQTTKGRIVKFRLIQFYVCVETAGQNDIRSVSLCVVVHQTKANIVEILVRTA